MNKPIRVLHIVLIMSRNGVPNFIMNYYRNIDRSKVQFDFAVHYSRKAKYNDEILKLGGKIHYIGSEKSFFTYFRNLRKVLKNNDYDAVHAHINFYNLFVIVVALISGVKVRVSHSHNSYIEVSPFRRFVKNIMKVLINLLATKKLACSELAAQWLYGKRQWRKGKTMVISNAIQTDLFKYDSVTSSTKRAELGIDNELVIGHVGNFVYLKNHEFIIDVFNEIYKKKQDTKLFLVGKGVLKEKIIKKVHSLGLEKHVEFLGERDDISELMQAFDVFLMPSIAEGLGFVLIEAQSCGLRCVVSDDLPKEAKVADSAKFISLKETPEKWAELILNESKIQYNKVKMNKVVRAAGYNIKDEAIILENMYLNAVKNKQM
ncbi:MAG: glycosyltransferase family 1 protein [Candidatus Zapsychrus exili]|nr:glycosyltransferase family 1 protein [Candidatus Zapsychrus exili]